MRLPTILIATALLITSSVFSQSEKSMAKNLNVSLSGPITSDASIYFDRKNTKKHGFNKVTESFEKAFSAKGFKIDKEKPSYILIIDYDYGYLIAAYKMQYSYLRGEIVEANNTSHVIGTFAYKGRYENEDVSIAIAARLNELIKQQTAQQKSSSGKSKEDRLIELKDLFDKGLITKEEYNTQKGKILSE